MYKSVYILIITFVACFSLKMQAQSDSIFTNKEPVILDQISHQNNGRFDGEINQRYEGENFNYNEENEEININTSSFNLSAINSILLIVTKIIFPLLFIILLVVGIHYLSLYIKNKGKIKLAKQKAEELINTEHIIEDIHDIDFEKHIKTALDKQAFTQAIRWFYLFNLKVMDDKKFIDWKPKKTNQDYYYELNQKHLKKEFKYLTYIYDYLWFGKFEIEQDEAYTILSKFEKFQLTLNQ